MPMASSLLFLSLLAALLLPSSEAFHTACALPRARSSAFHPSILKAPRRPSLISQPSTKPRQQPAVLVETERDDELQPSLLERRVPILRWLPKTTKESAISDVISGLTVATMLIPQGMAYASLAGLDPIIGLYCYVPLLVYAILGSSSFLAVGPVALVSTTLFGIIAPLSGPARLALATSLMFACGALSTLLGLLGLAKIVDYVPKEVLSAFTTGAAFNIMFTQLGSLFKINVATSHAPILMLRNAIVALPTLSPFTAVISSASIAMLLAMKRLPLHSWLKLKPNVPKSIFGDLGPFATMVLFTVLNAVFGLSTHFGLAQVGVVPSGLPGLSLPFGASLAGQTKNIAVLTFVMLVETSAIGKSLAAKAGQSVNNAQEFISLGVANMMGSFFSAYTCAGSFSRSAVTYSTGAKTQLAGIVTAAALVLTLLFLTPCFTHVPKSVLASCLIVAVSSLVDTKRIGQLWQQSKPELALYLLYVAAMLVFGAAEGLMASVGIFYGVEMLKGLVQKLMGRGASAGEEGEER